jgi:hypothetical protein
MPLYKSILNLLNALVQIASKMEASCQFLAPHALPPEKAPGTNWIRSREDDTEKLKFVTLPRLELRSLSRPARSQLYRLRYRAS